MGMMAGMLQVSTEELEQIIIDPSLLEERAFSEEANEDPNLLTIGKFWEGIFYMLTGKTVTEVQSVKSPLVWIFFSDNLVDEELNFGYGVPNYIDSDQVKQLNVELKRITSEDFKSRYDSKRMIDLNIYPNSWSDNGDDLEHLTEYFSKLKSFYEKSALENKCVINFMA